MDHLSTQKRSWNMARIRSFNTKPEILIRSFFHMSGLRFRVQNKHFIGNPDLYLKKYNTVIFVHGCFWHRHKGCKRATFPKSNTNYWEHKFANNQKRDKRVIKELKKMGLNVIIVWECQATDKDLLGDIVSKIRNGIDNLE